MKDGALLAGMYVHNMPNDIKLGDTIVVRLDLEKHELWFYANFGDDSHAAAECVATTERAFTIVSTRDMRGEE